MDMEEEGMENAAETIESLARENERLRVILLAKACRDLDELIGKLEAMVG